MPYVYQVAICVIHSLINVQRLELRLGPALHVSELMLAKNGESYSQNNLRRNGQFNIILVNVWTIPTQRKTSYLLKQYWPLVHSVYT